MQRRLVGRAPRADGRADEQREDADAGEHVVEQARAARHRRERDVRHLAGAKTQQRVGMTIAGARRVLHREHIGAALDRLVVDRNQHVAGMHAGAAPGRRGGDFSRDDTDGALDPEHSILDLSRGRARDDVRQAERQKPERHRHGQRCLPPLSPPRIRVVRGHGCWLFEIA